MTNLNSGNIQNYIADSEHGIVNGTEVKKIVIIDPITGLPITLTDGSQKTQIVEKPPTDLTKLNSSTVLSYDVNGDLQYIDETIGATTYRTTLGYTARVLTSISSAVEL